MPCYQCGSHEGSETVLCLLCRTERAKVQTTVRDTINGSGSGYRAYLQIIIEEWHLAIGAAVMILVVINSFIWFVYKPKSGFDATGLTGPNGDDIYQSCMTQLGDEATIEGLDPAALVDAYREELKGTTDLPTNPDEPVPHEILKMIVNIRAKEACSGARTTCESQPYSPECMTITQTYLPNAASTE